MAPKRKVAEPKEEETEVEEKKPSKKAKKEPAPKEEKKAPAKKAPAKKAAAKKEEKTDEEAKPAAKSAGGDGKVVVVLACKSCGVPKGRAEKLKKLVEGQSKISVKVNPVNPPKAGFVVKTEDESKTFLELLSMKTTNPGRWGPLKDVDFEELAAKIVADLA